MTERERGRRFFFGNFFYAHFVLYARTSAVLDRYPRGWSRGGLSNEAKRTGKTNSVGDD